MDIRYFYDLLGRDDTIYKLALITGFTQNITCGGLQNPFSTLFFAIIWACIYYLIASVIIYICPDPLKPLISILLIISMVYYLSYILSCR